MRALWNKEGTTAATGSCELSGYGTWHPERLLRWIHDTGAANSTFPQDAKIGTETESNECSYETVSGELIPDHGGLCVQGTTEYGYQVTFRGRKADVRTHSDQRKLKSQRGPCCNCGFEWRLHNLVQQRTCKKYFNNSLKMRGELGAVPRCLESGTCIGYTKIQQHDHTRNDQQLCSMHAKQHSGGLRHSRRR